MGPDLGQSPSCGHSQRLNACNAIPLTCVAHGTSGVATGVAPLMLGGLHHLAHGPRCLWLEQAPIARAALAARRALASSASCGLACT